MIIKNNLIPFKGFAACAIFPFIFIRNDWLFKIRRKNGPNMADMKIKVVMNHEKIHFAQQLEMMLVGCFISLSYWFAFGFSWLVVPVPFILFYVLYGLSWLWHLSKIKFEDPKQAYRNICFEREAYLNEYNMTYLKHRKFFGWIRFIKK